MYVLEGLYQRKLASTALMAEDMIVNLSIPVPEEENLQP